MSTHVIDSVFSHASFIHYAAAARQLAQSKGLYFNDQVVPDIRFTLHKSHLLDGRAVMIRAGKDKVILLATAGN